MTTAQDQVRDITVTIKTKEETYNADGTPDVKLGVDAPYFQSKYVTTVYVPEEAGKDLRPGDSVTLSLRAELKAGKSGNKPFDYNWRYEGMGDAEKAAVAAEPTPVAGKSDTERRSIENQKAADVAGRGADTLTTRFAWKTPAEAEKAWCHAYNIFKGTVSASLEPLPPLVQAAVDEGAVVVEEPAVTPA